MLKCRRLTLHNWNWKAPNWSSGSTIELYKNKNGVSEKCSKVSKDPDLESRFCDLKARCFLHSVTLGITVSGRVRQVREIRGTRTTLSAALISCRLIKASLDLRSILWRNELTTLLTFSLPWLGKHKQENHTNIYLSLFNGSVCPRDSFTQATDCFPTEQKPYKDLACYPAHSTCSINVSKCYDWNVHASWWVWHHWPPPIATGENTALSHLAAQTQENPVTP